MLVAALAVATLGAGGTSPLVRTASAALAAIAVCAASLRAGRSHQADRAAAGAWLCCLVLVAGGACLAPGRHEALLALRDVSLFTAVAWCVATAPLSLPMLRWGLLAAAAGQGVHTLVERGLRDVARPAGTFENVNHLAAWLVAVLLLAWGGPPGGRRTVLLRAAMSAPAVAGLVLAGSRGAVLGIAAGALALVLWRRASGASSRERLIVGAAAVLVLAGLVAGVALRLRSGDAYRYHRVRIWQASLLPALQAPWTGTGPGQFRTAAANLNFPNDDAPLRYERYFDSTHSDWLRLPVELGWPAAAAAVLAVLAAAAALRRQSRPEARAVAAAGAALLAHAAVENLSQRPALWLLGAVLAGTAVSTTADAQKRAPAAARALAAALIALVLAVGWIAPWRAARSRAAVLSATSPGEAATMLARAQAADPLDPAGWSLEAALLARADGGWDLARYARARELAEQAIRLDPREVVWAVQLARVEELACRTLFRDEAARRRTWRAYERAAALARVDPFVRLEQATAMLRLGDPTAALRAAERALRLEPRAVAPRLVLADAALRMPAPGLRARATRWLEEAEALARRWQEQPRPSRYARDLLALDPRMAASLRARLGGRP